MSRGIPLLVPTLLTAASIAAAQPPGAQGPPRGQGMPPRDRATVQLGTAVIRGRVLGADTGRPLRRARITATAPELGGEPRTASTGMDGRYEITDLPAGRYALRVVRSGYLPLSYGQRRPLEQGKPLQVLDKQALDTIDFALPRASIIKGQIIDELSEPVADVPVFALRAMYWQGRRRTIPVGPPSRTDEAGEFRLVGLAPGTYYVMANLRETWTVSENGVQKTMG